MPANRFSLEPLAVPRVHTPNRLICTPIPVPDSLPILRNLYAAEPDAMTGMAPVVWDRAEACSILDRWGNRWLDFTSGVLAANAGHNRPEVIEAVQKQAEKLLFAYAHPTEIRARLASRLVEITPKGLDRVFFFSGGSEAVECAIKLARIHGRAAGGDRKIRIVSFDNAFHGRTLGSQLAGGIPAMKEWIGQATGYRPQAAGPEQATGHRPQATGSSFGDLHRKASPDAGDDRPAKSEACSLQPEACSLESSFLQVPFPDGYVCRDISFDLFERSLAEQGVEPDDVAAVLMESFQGGDANFAPAEYVQRLAAWCREHDALLICDEIQSGFGRTGKLFGFEHYGIVPDLACFAKGLSGALPLAAVMGRADLMAGFPPRSFTTTYGANPVCCAGALANIDIIISEDLPARAERMGRVLHDELQRMARAHSGIVGFVHGRGLVAAVHIVRPGTVEPDPDAAFRIVESCVRQGLMLFAPVGQGAASIKICPPLIIEEDALREGVGVLGEMMNDE